MLWSGDSSSFSPSAPQRSSRTLFYSHPFRKKEALQTEVCYEAAWRTRSRCWVPAVLASSKAWASVEAFGTRNTFDLVVKDRRSKKLAVEIKLVSARGGRMPNGEIQRFLGQFSLAATKHDVVIEICGYLGSLSAKGRRDTHKVSRWFKARDISLVFRRIK